MCQIPDIGILNLRPHCKPQPIVVCLQSNSKSAPECTVSAPKMAGMVRAQLIFTRPRREADFASSCTIRKPEFQRHDGAFKTNQNLSPLEADSRILSIQKLGLQASVGQLNEADRLPLKRDVQFSSRQCIFRLKAPLFAPCAWIGPANNSLLLFLRLDNCAHSNESSSRVGVCLVPVLKRLPMLLGIFGYIIIKVQYRRTS